MLQQELAALEAFRQFFTHGLLDHTRTGKTDQRLRLADNHVAQHRQTGGNAAVDRIGQHGDERDAFFTQTGQHRGGLGHLHQGNQRFLHPRTAGSGEADHRATFFQGVVGGANETLTDDGAHRTAHEGKFERRNHDRHAQQSAAHGNQCVFFASLLLCSGQAVLVLLAVAEFQTVNRFQVCTQLGTAFNIEEDVDTGAGADTHVMVALGANVQGLFQLRTIQHSLARRAFVPKTFRHRALLDLGTHDRRDQFVY
ncbi:hypothetical protein D9M71_568980 [compost metagenome]